MSVATQKKRGRPKDEELLVRRREEILDAAAPVFAKHGYPGTDLQFIADALGIAKGTIYRYFPSKEQLFLAAADRGMRRLQERVDAAMHAGDDPLEQLVHAIHAYLRFFKDHPEFVELLVQERAEFRDRKKPTYFEHRETNQERWRDVFRALIAAGRVRDIPIDRIFDVVGDLLYGTMFTNYFAGRHKPLEAQARDMTDIVFRGFLSDRERRQHHGTARE